jgi:hypothetical protein
MKPNVSTTNLSQSQEGGNMKSRLLFPVLVAGVLSALTIPFLGCGAASTTALAQQDPTMTYSGTMTGTALNLQDGTVTDEVVLAGTGAGGQFTYRELHADPTSPQQSETCSGATNLYFPIVAGAGVFRFQDGSLMTVTLTQGAICVDLTALVGHLTESYQITGGTGNYQGASGTLTLTGELKPVLSNASGEAVLLTKTGEFKGTISK